MTAENRSNPEQAFTLTLTRPQLKVLYTALKTYFDDLRYGQRDLEKIVESILVKLPSEDEIDAIDLNLPD